MRSVSFKLSILVRKECKTSLSKMCWRFLSALVNVDGAITESKRTTLQYHSEKTFRNILGIWIVGGKSLAYIIKGICGKQLLRKCVLAIIRFYWTLNAMRYSLWLNIVVNMAKAPSVTQSCCSSLAISSSAPRAFSSIISSHDCSITSHTSPFISE